MSKEPAWCPKQIETRSVADLDQALRRFLPKIQDRFDLIVGVPRSGMLPASLIASFLDLPLVDLDGFLLGRSGATGERSLNVYKGRATRVLVVDDSIATGNEMKRVQSRIHDAGLEAICKYLVVYGTRDSPEICDYVCQKTECPRIFSWNIANSWLVSHACVDIDGLLCPDPDPRENDDGKMYLEFITNAPPLYVCRQKIKHLVTARLEKYRKETELWLNKSGIEFQFLHMVDLPDGASRIRQGPGFHARHKSKIFGDLEDALIFIESSDYQARDIAQLSGKIVFSAESGNFFQPSIKSIRRCQLRYYARHPRAGLGLLWRKTFGQQSS